MCKKGCKNCKNCSKTVKVKILDDCSYRGLRTALGSVVEATKSHSGSSYAVTAAELIRVGADDEAFVSGTYTFQAGAVEVVAPATSALVDLMKLAQDDVDAGRTCSPDELKAFLAAKRGKKDE